MVKVFGKPVTPPGYTCGDAFISTPVIVPYGCSDGCCEGCGPDGISEHHLKTHARDAIKIGATQAGVVIALDDGSGMGYLCPMPLDCMELRIRRKGERCFCYTLRPVGLDDAGRLDVRFDHGFHELRPGYYEALIVFNPGTPIQRPGGWLLFWKQAPTTLKPSSYDAVTPVDQEPGCYLEGPQISVGAAVVDSSCDTGDCNPCL